MARISLLSFSLLLLFSFSFASNQGRQSYGSQQGQCQIRRIHAREPSYTIQAEGGVTEFWDHNEDQFQCAGVAIFRHRIRSRGLLLPSYTNAPLLVYIVQGRGIHGLMISGCPETYQSSQGQQQQQQQEEGQEQQQKGQEGRRQRFQDRHQKIGHFQQGDLITIPAGAAHWCYNDGEQEIVAVVMQDVTNNANQLDQNPRRFFLAGNPQAGQQQQQQQQYGQHGSRRGQQGQFTQFGNVFRGFDVDVLADAFRVDQETARSLQGQDDQRGHIVTVQRGLQVISPPVRRGGSQYGGQEEQYGGQEEQYGGQEQQYGGRGANGIEETVCSAKVRENIDNPSRADIYNPRAGRFTTVNSLTFPILSFLQLSAARGVLYRNAIMAPHWHMNAHNIIYVTRGDSRMQIVDHRGQTVFDDQIREGQVVVVPQNFAVVKQAGEQGCHWVSFQTNDNAMMSTLSGRTSALRGLPADVIANSYQISREQAQRLKYSRSEIFLFSGRSSRGGRVASA